MEEKKTPSSADLDYFRALLPTRAFDAHKYSHGNVFVVGGSVTYPGALALVVKAAARSGSGYVYSAAPSSIVPMIQLAALSSVCHEISERQGQFASSSVAHILDLAQRADVIALGPGIGQGEGVRDVIFDLLDEVKVPVVLDADGISALCEDPSVVIRRDAPTIITPHAGEAKRLADSLSIDLDKDREKTARMLSSALGATIVYKGPHTVIASNEEVSSCPITSNTLATAGTGDVLTGVIAAIVSQQAPIELAVFLHTFAAQIAAERLSAQSVIATDVIEAIPEAFRRLAT